MSAAPSKWIAVVLTFITLPLGFLYVGHPTLAAIYLGLPIALAALGFVFPAWSVGWTILMLVLLCVAVTHSYWLAKRYNSSIPRRWYRKWYGLASLWVALGLLIILERAFLYEPFRVASRSMSPTIAPYANVIVKKWGYGNYQTFGIALVRTNLSAELSRGDIVVYFSPQDGRPGVHRLIGLPGDRVDYRNKRLTINGSPVPVRQIDDYVSRERMQLLRRYVETLGSVEYQILLEDVPFAVTPITPSLFAGNCSYDTSGLACTVPPGHYFVMGDNRDASADSRRWGFLADFDVLGKVVQIIH